MLAVRIDGGRPIRGAEADVTSMVQLSHHCEVFMDKINENFRVYYLLSLQSVEAEEAAPSTTSSPTVLSKKQTRPNQLKARSHSSRRLRIAAEDHYTDFILSWHVRIILSENHVSQ